MAKKRASKAPRPAKIQVVDDIEVDSDGDQMNDEIDQFHNEQDEKLRKTQRNGKAAGTREVLSVYQSDSDLTSSGEESDDSVDEGLAKKRKGKLNKDDIQQNLVSADAWGSEKTSFYGSRADQDWGGVADDEEEEVIGLEEEDAVMRQKKLDSGIAAVDFNALLESDDEDDAQKVSKKSEPIAPKSLKPSRMSEPDRQSYFIKHSPSLASFIEEFNERRATFAELQPTLLAILKHLGPDSDNTLARQLSAVVATYTLYLRNFVEFFHLKDAVSADKFKATENHPVLEDIMRQHPLMKKVDDFLDSNQRRLLKLADRLESDPSYAAQLRDPSSATVAPEAKKRRIEVAADIRPTAPAESVSQVFARLATSGVAPVAKSGARGPALPSMEEVMYAASQAPADNFDEGDEEEGDSDEEGEGIPQVDAGKQRKITYEMQKNRGLTPARRKDIAHSRTKKRYQYKKALQKKRSQVPDVLREVSKYDGEKRGIRASTVRSVKLKA
uniref:Sas10 domain-containing protein n=1 Tax=Panagrellus redivivus TaxID=6233 RepID=A0A7E4VX09_PANRE